jgi:hypothetical protein
MVKRTDDPADRYHAALRHLAAPRCHGLDGFSAR